MGHKKCAVLQNTLNDDEVTGELIDVLGEGSKLSPVQQFERWKRAKLNADVKILLLYAATAC